MWRVHDGYIWEEHSGGSMSYLSRKTIWFGMCYQLLLDGLFSTGQLCQQGYYILAPPKDESISCLLLAFLVTHYVVSFFLFLLIEKKTYYSRSTERSCLCLGFRVRVGRLFPYKISPTHFHNYLRATRNNTNSQKLT